MDEVIHVLHRIERHAKQNEELNAAQLDTQFLILKEIRHFMSTVQQGLQDLQQDDADLTLAVTSLTSAINAAAQKIADLTAELGSNEDSTVQTIAAHIKTQIAGIVDAAAVLNNAVTPPPPPVVEPPAPEPTEKPAEPTA